MPDIATLIAQGSLNLWLFIPSAILLGALHGLEPGHSKTMMAAFIVAIRGTALQAALLGLSATISHTAIVWLIALAGLYFGEHWSSETTEPYFQLLSAALMALLALWMLYRTWKHQNAAHAHHHPHDHAHHYHHGHCCHHDDDEDDHTTPLPHYHPPTEVVEELAHESLDPHALAHAQEIERRFKGQKVTTPQLILFGLTGGLLPCPASITVLLICLQLKKVALGALLVVCFSLGLALTMVTAGVVAALSVRHITRRWSGFSTLAARAPYISGILILGIALYLAYGAMSQLP